MATTQTIVPISSLSQDILKHLEDLDPERVFGIVFATRDILVKEYELEDYAATGRRRQRRLQAWEIRKFMQRIPEGRLLWVQDLEEYESIQYNPEVTDHWIRFHRRIAQHVISDSVVELLGAATAAAIAALMTLGAEQAIQRMKEDSLCPLAGPQSLWYRATRQVLCPGTAECIDVPKDDLASRTRKIYAQLIEGGYSA